MLMKKAGLIGGMSWESTVPYYKIINEVIGQQLGGLYSADCILHSINFFEIESTISKGNCFFYKNINQDLAATTTYSSLYQYSHRNYDSI